MPLGVIVDTSFLITLVGEARRNHEAAVAYWKQIKETGIPIYLSTIVVSEFEVRQVIDDDIRLACVPVLFTWQHALRAAKFQKLRDREREKAEGDDRTVVSDDIKIIAQAVELNVSYAITDDHNTFAKFTARWREEGRITFQTLILRDGFTKAHFEPPKRLTAEDLFANRPTPE